ncbi:hypothetical protein E4U55_005562 [Claviceps digitariae]|nr:hypothetical protein E4U55_005562 [Claviceps digitariae]
MHLHEVTIKMYEAWVSIFQTQFCCPATPAKATKAAKASKLASRQIEALNLDHTIAKTFSNLLNSIHHPFAGAHCSASGGASDSVQTQ